MAKLTLKDKQALRRLNAQLPQQVLVSIRRSTDGGFVAEIVTLPGVRTQGETFSELVAMLNDALYTYFEIPERYHPYVPTYLPRTEHAAKLLGFPVANHGERNVTLLAIGEKASR
ncbi:MAG: hypothetical protein COU11_01290 [Candidatus Harrisonbacteria bacterium CG10_big_fil_rev_8_21_14_0_10_49_15]|uniref:Type II toxin-antitoxin system HicB family antitoxin n=1 Tax=Candidatus Harrisonbacteria bacterium CG10_big_fil_rev_8_21_14_0_10_49_15 TaxID=1974587 RepID=A0A2H0ULJ8_9BACT|nr:MAG: hypothetical protein COU11_01290 [Candidatus Harrisonbacteria bacterium CG10_big_fil_rev_8_21_14_0_10_49_15]